MNAQWKQTQRNPPAQVSGFDLQSPEQCKAEELRRSFLSADQGEEQLPLNVSTCEDVSDFREVSGSEEASAAEGGTALREAPWEMKSLKPKHKQICSMLAQGIPRQQIAAIVDCTPEYITMLAKQPLMLAYIQDMCQAAGLQLDAMFTESVKAIGEVLQNGAPEERLKAARLQMEATKRIGSGAMVPKELVDSNERLAKLAERLLYLQGGKGKLIDGSFTVEKQNGKEALSQE